MHDAHNTTFFYTDWHHQNLHCLQSDIFNFSYATRICFPTLAPLHKSDWFHGYLFEICAEHTCTLFTMRCWHLAYVVLNWTGMPVIFRTGIRAIDYWSACHRWTIHDQQHKASIIAYRGSNQASIYCQLGNKALDYTCIVPPDLSNRSVCVTVHVLLWWT